MSYDVPFSESIIIYIGLATIFLGLIMFCIMIYQALDRSFRKKEEDEKKAPPGCLNQLIKLLLIFLTITFGFAILFFGAFIQSLTTFTKQQLVAEILCQEIDKDNKSMRVILIEKKGRNANIPQEFLLTGDRWFLRGDIIKWDNWVNFLGLHTMYKLNRIGGFFTDTKMENELKPTHYSLVPEEETLKWRWLYKYGYKLPLIDNVYGSSVSQYPELRKVFKIYVTLSGFSVGTEDEADKQ